MDTKPGRIQEMEGDKMKKENEIEIALHCLGVYEGNEVCEECPVYNEGDVACREAARAAIGIIREVKNYRKIGTLEELARGKKYIELSKKHGTVGELIDECAAYEEIGTVEECREAMANKKKCEKQWHNDMENPLEPIKVYSALKSEILKLELRIKNRPKDISILDYTVIAALQKVLKNNLEEIEDENT